MTLRWIGFAGALALVAAGAGPSRAEPEQGAAVVEAVDLARHEVVLDGSTYRVEDDTEVVDVDGNAIALSELPSLAGGAPRDGAAVWFETRDTSDRLPRLRELRLTGSEPR